jgi:hypothetical protein
MTNINTFQGSVGIGTNDPKSALHVSATDGRLAIADSSQDDCDTNAFNCGLVFVDNTWDGTTTNSGNPAAGMGFFIAHSSSSSKLITMRNLTGGITFATRDQTAAMNIVDNGDISFIGGLYVPEYIYHRDDTDTYIRFTDNTIGLYAGGSHKIGINATNTQFYSDIYISQYIYHYSDNNTYFGFSSNDTIVFVTNGGTAMTIDSDRFVGIAANANGYLSVRANYSNSLTARTMNYAPMVSVVNPSGADAQPIAQFRSNQGNTSIWNDGIFHRRGNGQTMSMYTSSSTPIFSGNSTRLRIHNSGAAQFNSQLYANAFNPNSDDRIKYNESHIKNAIKTLFKLKPQKYDKISYENDIIEPENWANTTDDKKEGYVWNDVENGWIKRTYLEISGITEAGLIAQDIWYDAPELRYIVNLPEDANPDETKPSDPDPDDPRVDPDYDSAGWGALNPATVNYNSLIPYLIKSIRELYNELPRYKTNVPVELYSNVQDYHHMIVSRRNENIQLTNTENDKTVHGVISDIKTDSDNYEILIEHSGLANVWVINMGSNIQVGDYITTSNVVGYGMVQNSNICMNHTLAKSVVNCDFTLQTVPIKQKIRQLQNKTYWIKTVDKEVVSEMAYSNLASDYKTTGVETYHNAYENKTSNVVTLEQLIEVEEPLEFKTDELDTEKYSNTFVIGEPVYTTHTRTLHYLLHKRKYENNLENFTGYTSNVVQETMDLLDANGQVQWEDTDQTRPLHEIRYLTIDGAITDQSNAVYTASLINSVLLI